MTFPDRKYTDVAEFSEHYFSQTARAAASVSRERIREAARVLNEAYTRGATVYCCGNGGSASIANHLMCDHVKGVQTDTKVIPRVVSLSSNVEIITAIANDIAYAD